MSLAREYKLRPKADADLEGIWFYSLDRWSLDQADNYTDQVLATLNELASGTRRGSVVPHLVDVLRCPVGSHAIFYQERPDVIDVVRILHQNMDPRRHLT
ncbi:type II toxin-antitoxin system RelE/ParE family toxin [Devosia rhizoryzae]|uniref:Toxin n=2 Tax=Devosia rhizoryzae TaxID=2774137 RepID=A0ABX7C4R2_9HYPH|nr:type II toxin-antitoxin system RelE/ParE family toxin [Devosia rhizoryzae]